MAFDTRSLAVFRIAIGSVVLAQLRWFCGDFHAFYQSDGLGVVQTGSQILLYVVLFGFLPIGAIALILGLFTRLSTLVCWSSLIFIQSANSQILQGGDVLLRLLLFWSLFLPIGEIWLLDSRRSGMSSQSLRWTTKLVTWALTLQICSVYWFASLLKSGPLWTLNGNALFYALSIEHFTSPLGLSLRSYPDFLRFVSFATPWFELIGPCLLFVPVYRAYFRLVAVALFVSFHLIGMEALLRIGLFPWVCASAWLIFIPGIFWDWLKKRITPMLKMKSSEQAKLRTIRASLGLKWPEVDYLCSCFVIVSFVDVLAWNVASLSGLTSVEWMNSHDKFGKLIQLDQIWNMYAPAPRKEHGWLVVPADLSNGTEIDLFNGKPVSWEKPADIGAYMGDDHWRRYLSNLFDEQDPAALKAYADYLVHNWNQSHGDDQKVQTVTIIFMRQETQPDLTVTSPVQDAIYFHAY